MIQIKDPMEHSRVRRIFKPAFADRALKEQEPIFMKYTNQLISNLRKAVEEDPARKFDMVKNYNCESCYSSMIFEKSRATTSILSHENRATRERN